VSEPTTMSSRANLKIPKTEVFTKKDSHSPVLRFSMMILFSPSSKKEKFLRLVSIVINFNVVGFCETYIIKL